MTGFTAAALGRDEALRASVSVRSLNHRFLELGLHLPRRLPPLEPEVRERSCRRGSQRGKVEVLAAGRVPDGRPARPWWRRRVRRRRRW